MCRGTEINALCSGLSIYMISIYLYICVSAIAILLYITQIMGLLARLLSPFAFNTRVIDDVRSNPLVSVSNCCNKNFEWSHEVNEKILHHKSINQMLITYCHLTCKVANYCLNVHERVEVVEWNERQFPSFSYCPLPSPTVIWGFSVSVKENFDRKKRCLSTLSAKIHLQDVLKMSYQDKKDILPRHLPDVQKMS